MHRDGHPANPNTIANLLKLHSKTAQISRSQGGGDEAIRRAEEFLIDAAAGGYMGHGKIPVGEKSVRELVKLCCLGKSMSCLCLVYVYVYVYVLSMSFLCLCLVYVYV